jgi:hypothetical protein
MPTANVWQITPSTNLQSIKHKDMFSYITYPFNAHTLAYKVILMSRYTHVSV